MRFRILLPVISVLLGVVLFHISDLQVQEIRNRRHPGGCGLQDGVATAKYFDYALNAPAWLLSGDTRNMLWSQSTYWSGHDLRYFLAVIVLWYLIGLKVDDRFGPRRSQDSKLHPMRRRIEAWSYVLLGLFVGCSMFPDFPLYLRHYLSSVLAFERGWWFVPLGLAWSCVLIGAGIFLLFSKEVRRTQGQSQ